VTHIFLSAKEEFNVFVKALVVLENRPRILESRRSSSRKLHAIEGRNKNEASNHEFCQREQLVSAFTYVTILF
jgi:hypothetical protein